MHEKCEFGYSVFSNIYTLPLTEDICKTKEQILLIATLSFAKYGYTSVSMRDLAKIMGFNQSSIYNHFESKEALWKEVISHAGHLYTLYFDVLDEKVKKAKSFREALGAIFFEPKRLLNVFTCYAFSMIHTEQFHDPNAGKLFEEVFMTHALECLKGWFDKCVEQGLVRKFDTKTVATIIIHSVLMGLQVEVHRMLNHSYKSPYDPRKMFLELEKFILWSVENNKDAGGAA